MSYHNITTNTTNAQGKTAPTGFHYMPDGSLMADADHKGLSANNIITGFDIDFNDIKEAGETRRFNVSGSNGAKFSLEITNEDSTKKYYNFHTSLFQTTKTKLDNVSISGGSYSGSIVFPLVTDADHYDFRLFAGENTKHINYNEIRFLDDSVDINSSTGSNSKLIQKVIYQTLDVSATISGYSGNGDIKAHGLSTPVQTIITSRGKSVDSTPFSITVSVTSGALTIDRQPVPSDIMAFVSRTIGVDPVNIHGEGSVNVITGAGGGTINGTGNEGGGSANVIMAQAVADIMVVGDRITGNAALDAGNFTVIDINVGGNVNTFTASATVVAVNGESLSFYHKRNNRWSINNMHGLDSGMEIKATTGALANGFSVAATIKEYLDETITFENDPREQRFTNVRIPALDTLSVKPTLTRNGTTNVVATVQTGNITFSQQSKNALGGQSVNIFAYGRDAINTLVGYDVEFTDLKAELNTVTTLTNGAVSNTTMTVDSTLGIADETTQDVNGAITASRYVVLDSVTGLGIGQSLYSGTGLVGTPTITAINETTKTITLSSVQTFADTTTLTFPNSIISGIGIDHSVRDPYVDTVSSLDLTTSVAQTLEDNQTFTFTGAGNIVTITGLVKINKVGNDNGRLMFDIDKFLTQH